MWAFAGALMYAAIPAVILMPRGNLDLGWPTIFAPGALAAGFYLLRRFGPRALPLCGAIAGACGLCCAIEYAVFLTMPLYIILAAYCYRRDNLRRWLAFAALGALPMIGVAAYFLVPTFRIHLFSDSAIRAKSLASATFTPYYSEDLISYLALSRKRRSSRRPPLYNATPQIPTA